MKAGLSATSREGGPERGTAGGGDLSQASRANHRDLPPVSDPGRQHASDRSLSRKQMNDSDRSQAARLAPLADSAGVARRPLRRGPAADRLERPREANGGGAEAERAWSALVGESAGISRRSSVRPSRRLWRFSRGLSGHSSPGHWGVPVGTVGPPTCQAPSPRRRQRRRGSKPPYAGKPRPVRRQRARPSPRAPSESMRKRLGTGHAAGSLGRDCRSP